MIRLGLTGTIGAGKSTVAGCFQEWGAYRIDADRLAREVVEPGTRALARIRETFGAGLLGDDGRLDRAAMRRLVFSDAGARARLEAIVHPAVDRRRLELLEAAVGSGFQVVVVEIPLLFEKGIEDQFDATVTVDAPRAARRLRVCERRGIAPSEFDAMDAAQWSGERKRAAADHVIWNDADRESLRASARHVWEKVVPPEGRLWRADLHMHTSASHDCLSAPEDVVRRARAVGLDRIAVTDHNEIRGALAAREIDPELVIVGEEVRTAEGLDLIGLFLQRHIPPGGSFRDVAVEIRRQGGAVYLPHPFDARRGTTEEFLAGVVELVDAVEGFNARVHDARRNRRAVTWAEAHGLPVGAGSDAHLLKEIGRGATLMPTFTGPDDFLAALEECRIEGRPSSHLVHLGSTWAKVWKTVWPA
jgi:dephospho-CoA kinase